MTCDLRLRRHPTRHPAKTVGFSILTIAVAGAAVADEAGTKTIKQVDCAVFASFIATAKSPLARDVMLPDIAAERVEEHMRQALEIGVPLIEAGGDDFPGLLAPRSLGGSAAAGIGALFSDVRESRSGLFDMQHGEPSRDGKTIDERLAALRDWRRLRASVMQARYDTLQCAKLLGEAS